MPSYLIVSRKTSPDIETTVTAPSREEAIVQIVGTAAVGERIEVFSATEIAPDVVVPAAAKK